MNYKTNYALTNHSRTGARRLQTFGRVLVVIFLLLPRFFHNVGASAEQKDAPTKTSNPGAEDFVARGKACYEKGDFEGAVRNYSKAMELNPALTGLKIPLAMAHNTRGGQRLFKGDQAGALEDFSQAIKLDPNFAQAHAMRANARFATKDFDGAIADATKALELDPANQTAVNNRALAYHAKTDFARAISDYSKAIKLDPRNYRAFDRLAQARQAEGDLEGALKDSNRAIEIDPRYSPAYHTRANLLQATGDYETALRDYDTLIRLNPKEPLAYFHRGFGFYNRGSWSQALNDFRRACEMNVANEGYVRLFIWLTRARNGERKTADQELKDYLNNQKPPDGWVARVGAVLLSEESDEAFLKSAQTLGTGPERRQQICEAFFYVGMKYLLQKDDKMAIQFLTRCVETKATDVAEYVAASAELKRLAK